MKRTRVPIRVLHVDDSALALARAEMSLSSTRLDRTFTYRGVRSELEFVSAMAEPDCLPDCIILDIMIADGENGGLSLLRNLRGKGYGGAIIMVSAVTRPETVAACLRAGASDFLCKGYDETELPLRILMALGSLQEPGLSELVERTGAGGTYMKQAAADLARIVRSAVKSVLVVGETGTGKEVIASLLQAALPPLTPFIPINCGAIKPELIESELFGYVKGAFTGADADRAGLLMAAKGGWAFLDEVARLSPAAQAALLRAIESGELRPVGSTVTSHAQIRFIAATNEDLEMLVEKGHFRQDLLQRLSGYKFVIPPLRSRADEIPEILDALLARLNDESSADIAYELTPAVRALFVVHPWQDGNVRQLWHTLQASTVNSRLGKITLDCLPPHFLDSFSQQESKDKPRQSHSLFPEFDELSFPLSFANLADDLFVEILHSLEHRNPRALVSQRRAATQLGMSRKAFQTQLRQVATRGVLPKEFLHLLSESASRNGKGREPEPDDSPRTAPLDTGNLETEE